MTDQNSLLIILLFFHSGLAGQPSFIMSFQTSTKFGNISTEEWAEFTGNIPDIEEFSACQWEMMRYFNEIEQHIVLRLSRMTCSAYNFIMGVFDHTSTDISEQLHG